jgi:ureidoacrylate peracid hydrolase
VIAAGTSGIDPVRTSDTYVEKGREVNTGAELVYKLARVGFGSEAIMTTEERLHRVALPAYVIERIAQRRSSAHAFERIDPVRTALVVVDLQNGFMAPGQPAETPVARAIVPNVNLLAESTRKAGGTVVWIKNTFDQEAAQTWTVWRTSFATGDWGRRMEEAFTPGNFGHELYAGLKTAPDDLVVLKRRFSALVQGSSGLDQILRQKGIDTLLIVGTATNVCCESTLRDGMMMNYKCIMVSDANATHTDEEHNATLAAVAVRFGDVRTSEEVVALLNARPNASG